MTTALLGATGMQDRLEELAAELGVPGAVVGVLADDEITVCATGVTKLGPDGAPVTADTLFLIGSIAKVWTATLVMQLVDEGRLELDEPVNRYLTPPLRLADQAVADTVTVRQLLTHTGGFYGDADEPPDRGEDAVERTVAGYAELPQLHQSSRSGSTTNCVELVPTGAVRDSKNPTGPHPPRRPTRPAGRHQVRPPRPLTNQSARVLVQLVRQVGEVADLHTFEIPADRVELSP